jgi:rod shape-determining protein MreD
MSLLLAAVGATAAALLEVTVGSYLRVGTAQPHVVLVLGLVWTIAAGAEGGLVWAFVGGLTLDVLAQRPMGTTAFALVVVVAVGWTAGSLLARIRPMAPVAIVAPLSLAYSMTLFVLFGALGAPFPDPNPVATLAPGVVYDVVLAAIVGPLAVAAYDRALDVERVDW